MHGCGRSARCRAAAGVLGRFSATHAPPSRLALPARLAAIGAGVLSLPYAFRAAGWAAGIIATFAVAGIEGLTMWVWVGGCWARAGGGALLAAVRQQSGQQQRPAGCWARRPHWRCACCTRCARCVCAPAEASTRLLLLPRRPSGTGWPVMPSSRRAGPTLSWWVLAGGRCRTGAAQRRGRARTCEVRRMQRRLARSSPRRPRRPAPPRRARRRARCWAARRRWRCRSCSSCTPSARVWPERSCCQPGAAGRAWVPALTRRGAERARAARPSQPAPSLCVAAGTAYLIILGDCYQPMVAAALGQARACHRTAARVASWAAAAGSAGLPAAAAAAASRELCSRRRPLPHPPPGVLVAALVDVAPRGHPAAGVRHHAAAVLPAVAGRHLGWEGDGKAARGGPRAGRGRAPLDGPARALS